MTIKAEDTRIFKEIDLAADAILGSYAVKQVIMAGGPAEK